MRVLAFVLTMAGCVVATTARPEDLTQPIRVSPNRHFLQDPAGRPFFWLGDTAWELFHRLDRNETDHYLQDRANKGFNVIQAAATAKLDFEGLRSPNRNGQVPFIGADPAKPNVRYFEHVDWVVDRAAHYGLRMAILPAWSFFFVSGGSSRVFDTVNAEAYGRWLARRYRGKGVIWVLGGDVNPVSFRELKYSKNDKGRGEIVFDRTLVDYRPVYDAMAKGIIAGDGGHPFITYHPTASSPSGAAVPRMSLYFGDRSWLDLSMLQTSHFQLGSGDKDGGSYVSGSGFWWNATFNYAPISAEYMAVPPRPVIDGEPRYEDHPILTSFKEKATEFWRDHQIRNAIYQSVFAGAAGHTYGNFTVWDFYDPGRVDRPTAGIFEDGFSFYERMPWRQALDAPGANQMQFAKKLMLSRPYFTRIPDQTLIVGEQGDGERHIGATRDRNGTYAMIYLPKGQPVTVDLSRIKGRQATAWWFDPRTGAATKLDRTLLVTTKECFVPPTQGEDQDWVLVLDSAAAKFTQPGAMP